MSYTVPYRQFYKKLGKGDPGNPENPQELEKSEQETYFLRIVVWTLSIQLNIKKDFC